MFGRTYRPDAVWRKHCRTPAELARAEAYEEEIKALRLRLRALQNARSDIVERATNAATRSKKKAILCQSSQ